MISSLEKERLGFAPQLLDVFKTRPEDTETFELLGATRFRNGKTDKKTLRSIKNICVILSGGPASGGHNVICGIFDAVQKAKSESVIYGSIAGPGGLVKGNLKQINANLVNKYRNHGGFDMLGTGRTKLDKEEQFESIIKVCEKKSINVIFVIGGDDSNTNAAIMDDYFKSKGVDIAVIGVPKTIDGDLKNKNIEITFGFDSATKMYSETIGNIENDAVSSRKYYHFIRVMGRSASHIALECALQCQPNITLISEEIKAKKMNLDSIADYIANIVKKRKDAGLRHGVCLVPEGIIEFIDDINALIKELNSILAGNAGMSKDEICSKLTPKSQKAFASIPEAYQDQLLSKRDPHGNVQVSSVESEKIIAEKVKQKLNDPEFDYQTHFLGYEGRCGFPTNFDCTYTYNLGFCAYYLALFNKSGYICFIKDVAEKTKEWKAGGIPLNSMITVENRNGMKKKVIEKALVNLDGKPFKTFENKRESFALSDQYVYPGPIQFTDSKDFNIPITLKLES